MKTDAIAHAPSPNCLNCGTSVHGHFCSHCGQDTANHMPSAGEFLHEFVGHYVALENKLLKTLTLLLFRPGRLTRDYLDGKRARYVLPLRLYLTLSLIFFAIFKWETSGFEENMAKPNPPAQQQELRQKDLDQARADLHEAGKQAGAAGGAVISAGEKALGKIKQKAEERRAQEGHVGIVEADGKELNWIGRHFGAGIQHKVAHFSELPSDQQWRELRTSVFSYAPYAIFAMMPMFALYLKLLYLGSGRRYGEHLLFALHTNAFAFLVLILMMLVPTWIPYAHGLMTLWLVFYLPTAMRKVYGGSRFTTFVRWMVAMILHLIGMTVAVFGAMAMAVVH